MSKWIGFGCLALVAGTFLSACGSDEGGGGGSGGSSGAGTGKGGSDGSSGAGTGKGGASSGTGGTSSGSACVQACQRMSAAACGDYANTDCLAPVTCPVEEACPPELDGFYSCVASTATVACSGTRTRATGCEAQATTYVECASCKVVETDTTCSSCVKTSCCEELTDWNLATDGASFDACIAPCELQTCVDDCVTRFPIAGAAYNATVTCQETSCTRPCVCGASDSDNTCVRCVKANCCDALLDYNQASDVAGFSACLTPCAETDQACADACVTRFPEAGAAYVNLVNTCLSTTCAATCSG